MERVLSKRVTDPGNPHHPLEWRGDEPVSQLFGDTFYSTEDGRSETAYVFLQGNLVPARWEGRDAFTIGELGFGTGLNFLETWRVWRKTRVPGQNLFFQSVEAFPLSEHAMAKAHQRWPELTDLAEQLRSVWHACRQGVVELDDQTMLQVTEAPVEQALVAWQRPVDAWYLDGFNPANNPEMWSPEVMHMVAGLSKTGATFATYSAAGWVRRNLEEAGFEVRRSPGFGRKRHMLSGTKL